MGKTVKMCDIQNNKVIGHHNTFVIDDTMISTNIGFILRWSPQLSKEQSLKFNSLLNESLKGHQIRLNVRMEYVDTIFFIFLIALY
jgi:hypothetical protein